MTQQIRSTVSLLGPAFIGTVNEPSISHFDGDSSRSDAEIVELFRRNRAILLLQDAVERSAPHARKQSLLDAIGPISSTARQRSALALRSAQLVDQVSTGLGIAVHAIKGLVSRDLYPEPSLRELRDADVAVESADDAFRLAFHLRTQGFSTDPWELPWLKADGGGALYGQYRLRPPDGYGPVDIHFGSVYSTGHCGTFLLPTPTTIGLRPMDVVANLRPMLGNSGGDAHVTLKDLNDAFLGFARLNSKEAAEFVEDASKVGLRRHLRAVTALAADCAGEAGVEMPAGLADVAAAVGHDRTVQRRSSYLVQNTASRRTRVGRTISAALVQSGEITKNPFRRAAITAGALRYYTANLEPRVASRPAAMPSRLSQWTCIRLLPASLTFSTDKSGSVDRDGWEGDSLGPGFQTPTDCSFGPKFVEGGVRSGNEFFLPTLWGPFSADLRLALVSDEAGPKRSAA